MVLKGKRILVIGLGKTGLSTVRFLISRGASVLATDEKPVAEWREALRTLERGDADIEACAYDTDVLSRTDMIIPSPGVPPANPILSAAVDRHIPVYSEIELASRFLTTPMMAITGTNGKTTTTTLIGELLKAAGKKVFVGGNIGNPLIDYVNGNQDCDYAVVEVSSFQLQWVEQFHPVCAILMNVTSDHIDYHGDFAAYRQIKERIFMNQTAHDLAVLNADEDGTDAALNARLAARVCRFSAATVLERGVYLDHETIVYREVEGHDNPETYPLSMIKIPGVHNIHNVMAAVAAARYCGCSPSAIIRCIENFRGISHRIEYSGEKRGIAFYDDSKGTNVGAVYVAVESFSRSVILLMGGRDKDIDFSVLIPVLKKKVKRLILFGEARDKIYRAIGDVVETVRVGTMKEAVETAYRCGVSGDIVLLSPGCASFDEFKDYKERGRFFKEVVGGLDA
ncbi:MAG: UDP-N-acetylmuramoyl-L-alanine--D-glutamate ligase [Deltaproteobacteria bacterium]|nr:UDP-N-acetylmuramoyl-L-alanine--D-glutamate ligase [Deltaproteobacteria bacterium]